MTYTDLVETLDYTAYKVPSKHQQVIYLQNLIELMARKSGIEADRSVDVMHDNFEKAAAHCQEACLFQKKLTNKSSDRSINSNPNISVISLGSRVTSGVE